MTYVPSLIGVVGVKLTVDWPSGVTTAPSTKPLPYSVTVLLDSTPLISKVGVLSLVMLSVLEEPESLVNLKSGALGCTGAVMSLT